MTQKEKDKIRNKSYYLRNKDKIDSKSKKLYDEKIMFLKLERGGKCEKCGYCKNQKILQFHHLDPLTKLFEVSSRYKSKKLEDLILEADKCQLLCPNCHYEITYPV